jgi:hypothetical protein
VAIGVFTLIAYGFLFIALLLLPETQAKELEVETVSPEFAH